LRSIRERFTGEVRKSQAPARSAYLQGVPWQLSDTHRDLACASEDAFDAAVSALVMADHWPEIETPMLDRIGLLEGQIWVPSGERRGYNGQLER
jgi:hypothetical protein